VKKTNATPKVALMAVKPYFLNFDCPVTANAKKKHAQMMSATNTIQRNKYIGFPI
jgi:hypothetical protein